MRVRPGLIVAALAVAVAAAATAGAAYLYLAPPERPQQRVAAGQPDIGGAFTLVNGDGERVSAADFRGRYMLIYFGYTSCPDVCPTALAVMTQALDRLAEEAPEKAKRVVPLFITIDPARDDADTVAAYVDHFHPRMVGLTGSPEQIAEAAEAYRVYYKKAEPADGGPYTMDHTSFIYLMGPDGDYLKHQSHGRGADALTDMLRGYVETGGTGS